MTASILNLQQCFISPFSNRNHPLILLPRRRILHLPAKNLKLHQFSPLFTLINNIPNSISPLKSASSNGFSIQNQEEDINGGEKDFGFLLQRWITLIRSFMPGGSWWRFNNDVQIIGIAKPVTVLSALRRMWRLVSKDKWVIFAAFPAIHSLVKKKKKNEEQHPIL